ncbi:ATP-binding cassette domain-containing protein [Cohnella sp. CFH 77786]|uniref:ABC transporter ATP-binding protein n=1 Tax=Cohnella sp. CFH 77786 TaxID=2662265 RepID=UPI001C60B847|nr:ABC transporter ATP-binding protein [Cohnella sp. CFH 77786]MBW5447747.1 ATP-binding cassette domain-containing protein [Cohnella sp. CFH 77786]
MGKKAIIRASNLCKTYFTGTEQYHAIRNVDLEIYEGDFTVIMGSSGSGKSTLLYLLSGLDSVTAGEIYFQEQNMDRFNERELAQFRASSIGYIYQSINLVPDLTLFDNVALPGYIAGRKKTYVKQKAMALMSEMGIDQQCNRLPSQTSGGQQQRAAIARALINDPAVIFADEPTGSLNYEHGVSVLNILTRLNRLGQTVVMVTHDMKAACRANRLILIGDGKIRRVMEFGPFDDNSSIEDREKMIFAVVTEKELIG